MVPLLFPLEWFRMPKITAYVSLCVYLSSASDPRLTPHDVGTAERTATHESTFTQGMSARDIVGCISSADDRS